MGALVLGPAIFREFLVNRARSFIYATAPSPLMAAGVRAALKLSASSPVRRERLAALIETAGRILHSKTGHSPSGSQIQPIVVGSDARATALAAAMQNQGFDMRAVRPPTVPEGTARLRISLTLNASDADVVAMIDTLARELERVPS